MSVFKDVYFDNNATTPVDKCVEKKLRAFYRKYYGNPSSIHRMGVVARGKLDEARRKIAGLLNCTPDEIYFTSGGTEANNLAIKGAVRNKGTRNHIITSCIEHSSVLDSCRFLQKKGFDVTFLPVNRCGKVEPEVFKNVLTERTVLASVMLANNEVGTIQDIALLSDLAHANGTYFHCDCVQAFCKMPVDLKALPGVTFATVSSHKVFGPEGVGALFIKKGTPVCALIHGGHQENQVRGGTENLPGIYGFAVAAEKISSLQSVEKYLRLKNRIFSRLKKVKSDICLNGSFSNSLPNTINLWFPGIDNRDLLAYLSLNGIYTSTGAACSESHSEYSHVITDLGYSEKRASESLRISFGVQNTVAEVDYFVKVFRNYCSSDERIVSVPPGSALEMICSGEFEIIDVRNVLERRIFQGIQGARECSLLGIRSECSDIPLEKPVLLYCQNGLNAYIAAWILKRSKFKNIYVVRTGLTSLRLSEKLSRD